MCVYVYTYQQDHHLPCKGAPDPFGKKTICHFQGRTSLLLVHLILTELKNCECMATIQLPFMLNPTMVLFPTGRSSSNPLEHGVWRFSAVTNSILSGSTQQPQEYRLKNKTTPDLPFCCMCWLILKIGVKSHSIALNQGSWSPSVSWKQLCTMNWPYMSSPRCTCLQKLDRWQIHWSLSTDVNFRVQMGWPERIYQPDHHFFPIQTAIN